MELVPLKVKIGLKNNGQHDFPSFNEITPAVRDDIDWSHYVDKYGGWHYDQICGHADEDPDSPRGTWLGMLMVPSAFAQEAIAKWPSQCSILTDAEAKAMYDDRCHYCDAEVKEDATVLQAIAAKRTLGVAETQGDIDALDPSHPSSGRRINKKKTYVGFKTAEGITVKV